MVIINGTTLYIEIVRIDTVFFFFFLPCMHACVFMCLSTGMLQQMYEDQKTLGVSLLNEISWSVLSAPGKLPVSFWSSPALASYPTRGALRLQCYCPALCEFQGSELRSSSFNDKCFIPGATFPAFLFLFLRQGLALDHPQAGMKLHMPGCLALTSQSS